LSAEHTDGVPKARFFESFGFERGKPELLRQALMDHAMQYDVAASRKTKYSDVYEIRGQLTSPDGRNPIVLIVWMIPENDDRPRLITAVPSRDKKI
jgi:hypothetical protein